MRIFREDWSEESQPLVVHKGNEERDIVSKVCEFCGRSVQVIGGKMKYHRCLELEKRKFDE